MQKKINVSVREIADFSLGGGGIEKYSGFNYKEAALEGTFNHVRFQKEMIKEHGEECFLKEVFVSDLLENDVVSMSVTGRIDGVLVTDKEDDSVYIYEIKTTAKNINEVLPADRPEHLGQAQCYAYMYMKIHEISSIKIRLVYINRENSDQIIFEYLYALDELAKIYNGLVYPYLNWITGIRRWQEIRNQSIEKLQFPFATYRSGQKELMGEVYNCIEDGVRLFATAPTGIGKTMGVLFPAIKALGSGLVDKLMYLTAKTVTATVAVEAYRKLEKNGLNLRTVTITAKDKVCPMKKRDCDPDKCHLVNQYFLRARPCLKDMLHEQFFDKDIIAKYAKKYDICPFELSLDLSNYCDLIICDYNYLFDPRIRLQRYFDDEKNEAFCFMVDEAHNLVERGREMFSCALNSEQLKVFKKSIKKEWKTLTKRVNDVIVEMNILQAEHFQNMNDGFIAQELMPLNLLEKVNICLNEIIMYDTKQLPEDDREDFLDGMFNLLYFARVSEFYDKRFVTFFSNDSKGLDVKLMRPTLPIF